MEIEPLFSNSHALSVPKGASGREGRITQSRGSLMSNQASAHFNLFYRQIRPLCSAWMEGKSAQFAC